MCIRDRDISWKRINHPSEALQIGESVQVKVIKFNDETQRISLGIKQCIDNPWEEFKSNNKVGETIEGEIRNITEFGLFIGLSEDIDGLVHLSDLSWDGNGDELIKTYSKGTSVKTKILDIDIEKERISLGIKQLTEDIAETIGNEALEGSAGIFRFNGFRSGTPSKVIFHDILSN